jgi:hypothetical protein
LKGFDATTTEVITPKGDFHPVRKRYSDDIGKTLATLTGPVIEWTPSGNELYFRASITSSKPHPNPSMKDQKEMAWTQPMGWR